MLAVLFQCLHYLPNGQMLQIRISLLAQTFCSLAPSIVLVIQLQISQKMVDAYIIALCIMFPLPQSEHTATQ